MPPPLLYKSSVSAGHDPLRMPLAQLRGVGPDRAAQLVRLGLLTVEDLLLHRPRRYEDRRNFQPIRDLQLGQAALTHGKVLACGVKYWRKRERSVCELILDDGTGRLYCRWWNLPFMEKYFRIGDEVVVYGKINSLKPKGIDHPETEVIDALEASYHINRITPIYPLTEGLQQRWLRSIIARALEQYEPDIAEPRPELRLPDGPRRSDAIRMIHFPMEMEDVEIARRRLALDEFIEMQWAIQTRRKNMERNARSRPCAGDNHLIKPFLKKLGFTLTDAQTGVLKEIRRDMAGPHPMRRLLQGDVGSGKTVVAACTALMALESGLNAALMAPTEILAEQHCENFRRWLEPLGVTVALLTGSRKDPVPSTFNIQHSTFDAQGLAAPKRSDGGSTLFIGTHALIDKSFTPERLGLVIIDEQHKFGVAQRETFVRKGDYPHLLVMTATPIPRTLGLTLYGDLDISVIAKPPPGRGRTKTFVRTQATLPKVWEFMRQKLGEGRQGYIVYSRLEEEDTQAGIKAVTHEFERLEKIFAPYRLGLIHGQLNREQKETIMAGFRQNKIHLLLATSVVEVGVDVPNATLMLIENADQFGLAQLHQLRGRIGRGAEESYCILIAEAKTPEARQRLKVLEDTTDGFRVAEMDLQLRGPGEFLGRQQSGAPPLRFGNFVEDLALIGQARLLVQEALHQK